MKKLLFLIIIFIVGYWLISPLFIDKKVNESLDPVLESAIQKTLSIAGEGIKKAGEKIKDTDVSEVRKKVEEIAEDIKGSAELGEKTYIEDKKLNIDDQLSGSVMALFQEEM